MFSYVYCYTPYTQADKKQLRLVLKEAKTFFLEVEHTVPLLTNVDVDELFYCYDVDRTDYVMVGYLRERVRSFMLKERVSYEFFESFSNVKDDDMVNRMVRNYL